MPTSDDYTVAWIAPLEVELTASIRMLDVGHKKLPQSPVDHNVYHLGSINNHNIVIASLPTTGNSSAAMVITQLRNTYKQVRYGLLVGIGGVHISNGPIHLGDVVVNEPVDDHSGTIHYDHGKALEGYFQRTGYLHSPPNTLLNAVRALSTEQAICGDNLLSPHLERIDTKSISLRHYQYPGVDQDYHFNSNCSHLEKGKPCDKCGCDPRQKVDRSAQDSEDEIYDDNQKPRIKVHRGTIAAGEKVIRNGQERDHLANQYNILCFEMEAAGVMNDFPCLAIRGISDYADSHKDDRWQGYASAVAAAYARELFFHMPIDDTKGQGNSTGT
ncbi:purine and uridine phosphorylase [Viridothelium virens]|uniref:Purine and uridine phosphorylase n=1 Tax=Viridothelium virens TaxID=1048519 RepID=A0A6A6GVD0_VIRVR|nr:purine and uridine phosphorylase [Viridothelium virens]